MPHQTILDNDGMEPAQKHYCLFCRKEIHCKATKCPECGSFQNWRRNVNLSITLLSLVIALVSVSGIVVPIIQQSLTDPRSNISLEFAFVDDSYAYLYLANSGARPALIESLVLKIGSYTVDFQPSRIGNTDDEKVASSLETDILRLERQHIRKNGFVQELHPLEMEAYGDHYHQWSFHVEARKLNDIAKSPVWPNYDIPSGGLEAEFTDSELLGGEHPIFIDVRIGLTRVQSLVADLSYETIITLIDPDDFGPPSSIDGALSMLADSVDAEAGMIEEDIDVLGWYLETCLILGFLDRVFEETPIHWQLRIRHSDGEPEEFQIPLDYRLLKTFLRPIILGGRVDDPKLIGVLLPE